MIPTAATVALMRYTLFTRESLLRSSPGHIALIGQSGLNTLCQEVVPAIDCFALKTLADLRRALCRQEPGCAARALLLVAVDELENGVEAISSGLGCSNSFGASDCGGVWFHELRLCKVSNVSRVFIYRVICTHHSHHSCALTWAAGEMVDVILEVTALEEHVGDKSGLLSLGGDLIGLEGLVDCGGYAGGVRALRRKWGTIT